MAKWKSELREQQKHKSKNTEGRNTSTPSEKLGGYSINLVDKKKTNKPRHVVSWLYRFKTRLNHTYIVEAHQHDYDLFIIKFYKKNEKLSKHRYNVMYNDFDGWRIMGTCLRVAQDILKHKPEASFGFMGEPTMKECENENSRKVTKRYRVYKQIAVSYFSPDGWDHVWVEEISAYMLFNLEKTTQDLQKRSVAMLKDLYPDLENISISFSSER